MKTTLLWVNGLIYIKVIARAHMEVNIGIYKQQGDMCMNLKHYIFNCKKKNGSEFDFTFCILLVQCKLANDGVI